MSTTVEAENQAFTAKLLAEWYEQPNRCGSCRYWREKAQVDSDPPVGVCDHPSVRRQVGQSGASFFRSLALEAGVSLEKTNKATDWLGVRFGADFGCRHWVDADGPEPEA